ncbi:MAG: serine/threonine protein kinase [Sandaracinaceae bacterium]|nr:serine/threonine protein kinase [Sandaracinaceae bacterium]
MSREPDAEALEVTLLASLAEAGIDARTIAQRPGDTIAPARPDVDSAARQAIARLGAVGAGPAAGLRLSRTLGEGGMGVVHLAVQTALGREVAVKTVKAERRDERAELDLLREGWVTGAVEHPNVVPIHDLGLDAAGAPLLVMKKIEGDAWSTLLGDAALVAERFGTDDLLAWNLGILMQVCHALHYAHSRGVVHRDLKPDNVMIGRFGEVYLLDWGLAVALEDDGSGRMPLARDAHAMAGTPCYMAPEMLGGAGHAITTATDVYLLGAVLHELVTGRPPHVGARLIEVALSIASSPPKLPADVSPELAALVEQAMQRAPADRVASADVFRRRLAGYLDHRSSERLAARADRRRVELEARLRDAEDPAVREDAYRLFAECRFGFRHALEVWPDSVAARRGLDAAALAMIEYELGEGDPRAAHALLTDLGAPPDDLVARVERAGAAKRDEDDRLRRVQADLDPATGRATRVLLAAVMGVLWVVMPVVATVLFRTGASRYDGYQDGTLAGLFALVVLGLAIWKRAQVGRTLINRGLVMAALVAMSTQALGAVYGALAERSPWAVFHDQILVFAAIVAMLTILVDRRMLVSALAYVAGFLVVPLVGDENVLLVIAACNLVSLVTIVAIWGGAGTHGEAAPKT